MSETKTKKKSKKVSLVVDPEFEGLEVLVYTEEAAFARDEERGEPVDTTKVGKDGSIDISVDGGSYVAFAQKSGKKLNGDPREDRLLVGFDVTDGEVTKRK